MRYQLNIIVLICSLLLGGCDSILQSPEEKINAAIPMSRDIEQAMLDVLQYASDEKRELIENELANRLKLRALTCSDGYAPSWNSTAEDIRKSLRDRSCLNEKDLEIAKWIGFLHVSLIQGEPPLKPMPSSPQKYYVADEHIWWVYPAENAGIMLVTFAKKGFQLIDLDTGDTIFKEVTDSKTRGGRISANGRLFTSGNNQHVDIRRSDTGAVVGSMPGVGVLNFQWFGNRGAVYNLDDNRQAMLLDFSSGRDAPLAGIQSTIQDIIPLDDDRHFLISTSEGVSKIEVEWTDQAPVVKLVSETVLSNPVSTALSGFTSDGKRYFGGREMFNVVSTDSFEKYEISLEPFLVMKTAATPDPDKIIIKGFVRHVSTRDNNDYLYSISDRTFALIDKDKLITDQYLYLPALTRQAAIRGNKLIILDSPDAGEPVEVSEFVSSATMEQNLKKLEEFDKQQSAMQIHVPGMGVSGAREIAVKPMLDIAHDAKIEAVGVYQGVNGGARPGQPRKTSNVDVRVRRSDKPVVLVLSSYEPVLWRIVAEPGARLDAVIISGHHASTVIGAGSTRTVVLGTSYAYKRSTREYLELDNEVFRLTGKRITMFQGNYEGKSFIIGGTGSG
jgi:hypothetical protein